MSTVFAVFKNGVYRQECGGIFSEQALAEHAAHALILREVDDYHHFDVVPFTLNATTRLQDPPGSWRQIEENDPVFAISRASQPFDYLSVDRPGEPTKYLDMAGLEIPNPKPPPPALPGMPLPIAEHRALRITRVGWFDACGVPHDWEVEPGFGEVRVVETQTPMGAQVFVGDQHSKTLSDVRESALIAGRPRGPI